MMKTLIKLLWLLLALITISVVSTVVLSKPAGAQVSNQFWKLLSGNLQPVVNTYKLKIPQLGGSGARCIHVDNAGLFSVATADCGTGSGGGADGNWVFFNNSGIRLATTSNQVVIGASASSTASTPLEIIKTSIGNIIDTILVSNLSLTAGTEAGIFFSPSNAGGTSRGARISAINDGANVIGLKFYTGSGASITEKMRITGGGNVGIGSSTPWRALSVTGSSDLGTNALAGNFTATTSTASVLPYASSTAITVSGAFYNTSLSDGCANITSGKLGSTGTACGSGGSTGDSVWSRNATTRLVYTPTTTDPVAIGVTSTSTAATLLVDPYLGLVGIGTSSPSRKAKLDVVGDAIIGNENYQGQDIYLMASFRSDDDKKVFIQASADGKTWKQIGSAPVVATSTGGTRDPRILYYNGTYYMSYTNVTFGQTNNTFTIMSSPDLLNWTRLATPSLSAIGSVTNVWSPNWYQDTDGSVHIFVDVSTAGESGPWALYELHPSVDGNLSAWSTPVAVTGLPANTLDGNVQYRDSNGVYYLWYKEETTKYTEYATSTALTGPYTVAKSGDWAGWGSDLEGISLMNIGGGKWRIYFDKYTLNGIYYSESSDNWATWTTKALITTPYTVSNPGITRYRNVSVARNIESAFIQTTPISYTSGGNYYLSSTTPNFGVGTTNPTEKLHVVGNEYLSGSLLVGATSALANATIEGSTGLAIKNSSATTPLYLYTNTSGSASLSSNVNSSNTVIDSTKPQWAAVMSQASDSFAIYRSPIGATWAPVANLYVANTGLVGIGTTSPYAKLSVVGEVVGANFTATTTTKSTFPYASSTALTVSGALYNTSLANGCLNVTSGLIGSTGSACGAGGGGSGGGTWSTTTSTVSGQLINYPNNTTDVPCIGSNATTSCEFYFDPNTNTSRLGLDTGFLGGAVYTNGLFGTKSQTMITGPVNDLQSNIVLGNTYAAADGIYAMGGQTFVNGRSTVGATFQTSTYYAYQGFSGPNFALFNGVPPNSFVSSVTDGSHITGATSANPASSTIARAIGAGFSSANYDEVMRFITDGPVASTSAMGYGTTTPAARFAITFLATSTKPAFLLASSTNGAYASNSSTFVVMPDGKVGLGSSTPSAKLSVAGSGQTTTRAFAVSNSSNVEKFTILDGGNVGIGNSAPSYKLDITNTDGNSSTIARIGSSTQALFFLQGRNMAGTYNNLLQTITSSGSAAGELALASGNVEAVRISNGAYVGVGTSSPLNKLQVSYDATGSYASDYNVGQFAITGATDARKRTGFLMDTTNNWFAIQSGQYGLTTYPIKLNPMGGKIGINDGSTVAPTYRLTGGVPSTALNTFLSAAPSAFVNQTSDNGTTFAGEYTGASGAGAGAFFTLQSNDGAALSSGDRIAGFNFGGFDGSASANSGAVTAWAAANWSGTSRPTEIRFENTPVGATSRSTRMVLASEGQVGIASSTPWRTLSVTGTVAFDGLTSSTAGNAVCILANDDIVNASNTTCSSSARDTKKDITDLTPLEVNNIILGLKPVAFNYKESGERRVGFIAEDVAKVDTRLVEYAKDDINFEAIGVKIKKGNPISVQYANLTSILTKFVQGFYKEFQAVVARVSGLEKKVNDQEQRIKALEDKLSKIK